MPQTWSEQGRSIDQRWQDDPTLPQALPKHEHKMTLTHRQYNTYTQYIYACSRHKLFSVNVCCHAGLGQGSNLELCVDNKAWLRVLLGNKLKYCFPTQLSMLKTHVLWFPRLHLVFWAKIKLCGRSGALACLALISQAAYHIFSFFICRMIGGMEIVSEAMKSNQGANGSICWISLELVINCMWITVVPISKMLRIEF